MAAAWMAGLHSALGDSDRALGLLERDVRDEDRLLSSVYEWEFYDRIRENPRFAALLQQMNLPGSIGRRRVTVGPRSPPLSRRISRLRRPSVRYRCAADSGTLTESWPSVHWG